MTVVTTHRLRIMSASLALAFALALALADTAIAGGIAIRRVDSTDYPTIRVTLVTPTDARRAPVLTENGRSVVGLQAENLGRKESIVLALDHSQSMYNKPLADAKAAARTFADAKPEANQIAVVAFASEALILTGFSSSTTDADGALNDISTDPVYGTALYDAVVLAARELSAHGLPGRVVILVTDGQETTSKATLVQAIKAARTARAVVYAIAIPSGGFSPGPLQELARTTGGRYYRAPSSAALKGIYETIGTELKRTWRLQYETAARPGDLLRLVVRSGLDKGDATKRLPGQPDAPSGSSTPVAVVILVVLVAAALLAIGFWPRLSRLLSR